MILNNDKDEILYFFSLILIRGFIGDKAKNGYNS